MQARSVRLPALASVMCLACVLFIGSQARLECGMWTFSGTPVGRSFPLTDTFAFNPAKCGKTCDCSQDPIIPMPPEERDALIKQAK